MTWLLAFAFVGIISAATAQTGTGGLQAQTKALVDMLKNMMLQPGPPKAQVAPLQPLKPPNPFLQPLPPSPFGAPGPMAPPTNGGGLFMDLPQTGGHYGGGPYGGPPMMMRSYHYCPPGPTTADHCKDQKLREALYYPDGRPRYNWVPQLSPWDTSLPDTVKDTAMNILMMKVNSRPDRRPTPKEMELMSMLGDPKEQGPAHANPFATFG